MSKACADGWAADEAAGTAEHNRMTRVTHFQVKEAICARLAHKDRRAVNLATRALLQYVVVSTRSGTNE